MKMIRTLLSFPPTSCDEGPAPVMDVFHFSLKETAGNHSTSLDCRFKSMRWIQLTGNAYNVNSTDENHYKCYRRGDGEAHLYFPRLIKKFPSSKKYCFRARSAPSVPGTGCARMGTLRQHLLVFESRSNS